VSVIITVTDTTHVGAGAQISAPTGIIARDMLRRGYKVERRAKELCPVDTGRLRASISLVQVFRNNVPVVQVGTNVYYAQYVEFGTGIYGPRHQRITPKNGRYLVFKPRGSRDKVFARSVAGSRPRPFLTEALPAALD
jgi:HK97 gp10 family phage protein